MLDGGEYTKTNWKTKARFIFSIRTEIPTLIDKIEHDFSSRMSIYMLKVNKIERQLTQ